MKIIILSVIILFAGFTMFAQETIQAQSTDSKQMSLPYAKKNYSATVSPCDNEQNTPFLEKVANGPIRKLGRGLSNTIFGFLEILIQPYKVGESEDGGIAACTYGVAKGITYFLGREIVGVVEIITFPMPLPGATNNKYETGWGYGPLMRPEWIFELDDNPYDFIHQNHPVE